MSARNLLMTEPQVLRTEDVQAVYTLTELQAALPVGGAVFRKTADPASVSYAVGVTVLNAYTPATGYRSIVPLRWSLPPKVGNVQVEIKFTFSDASTLTRANSTGGTLVETFDGIDFDKDGLYITTVTVQANNVAGAPEVQDLAAYTINGLQYP
jgi:hypothetical protein